MLMRLAVGVETRLPGYGAALARPRLYIDSCPTTRSRSSRPSTPATSSAKNVHAAAKQAADAARARSLQEEGGLIGDIVTKTKEAAEAVVEKSEMWYDELVELLDAGKVRLIDVRKPVEIDELGMIPSSINIPLSELSRSLNFSNEQFRAAYGIDKPCRYNEWIVFYAKSGDVSAPAVDIAKRLGYHRARHYVGGWYEWSMKSKNDY